MKSFSAANSLVGATLTMARWNDDLDSQKIRSRTALFDDRRGVRCGSLRASSLRVLFFFEVHAIRSWAADFTLRVLEVESLEKESGG